MLTFENNKITYNYSQCQQCGVCEAVCPKCAITMKFISNGTHEVLVDNDICIKCQKCVKCCPANKTMQKDDYFKDFTNNAYFLGYNANLEIRRASSSGGVCKTLVIDSLKQGLVDGVYTLKRLDHYPGGEGMFYTIDNIPSYNDLANSVYHSVMIGTNLNKVKKCNRLMIVGTACQLRALEKALKGKYNELVKICIFCKQQKTLESTRFLAKMMGAKIPENLNFSTRYRGDGWQGIVHIGEAQLPWNRAAVLPFGRRLWTVPGCDCCGDPFGVEVECDMSLMDPWCIRQPNELGETLVKVNTVKGLELLNQLNNIVLEHKTYSEVYPALGISDVIRKRATVPYFRKTNGNTLAVKAGKAEVRQRKIMQTLVSVLPRMPYVFYYSIARFFPDFRNKILRGL